jgi:hypothetical protein
LPLHPAQLFFLLPEQKLGAELLIAELEVPLLELLLLSWRSRPGHKQRCPAEENSHKKFFHMREYDMPDLLLQDPW